MSLPYPRIAAKLASEPWGILPEKLAEIHQGFLEARASAAVRMAADDKVGPVVNDFWTGEPRLAHPQVETMGPVAVAMVHGVTGRGLSRMEMQCGGFDTGLFVEQMQNVAEDPAVRVLVIDFHTPGGMVAGNARAVQAIDDVRAAGKKVIGYTKELCASCGYWMAAACDEFHADPDARVGSISTICSGVDSSKAWEQEGLQLKLFATGKFKATGMDGKEWTAEEEQMMWDRLRPLDMEFKGYVQDRRQLAAADMEGQWWYAKHAPAGVVDSTRFESLAQLVEAIWETL